MSLSKHQLAMSFRLHRQKSDKKFPLRSVLLALGVIAALAIVLVELPSNSWSFFTHGKASMCALPIASQNSQQMALAPMVAPTEATSFDTNRWHSPVMIDKPAAPRRSLQTPAPRFVIQFEGRVSVGENPSPKTLVTIHVNAGQMADTFTSMTNASGDYSITAEFHCRPNTPLDWTINVSRRGFHSEEQTGRRIAMDPDSPFTVTHTFSLQGE